VDEKISQETPLVLEDKRKLDRNINKVVMEFEGIFMILFFSCFFTFNITVMSQSVNYILYTSSFFREAVENEKFTG